MRILFAIWLCQALTALVVWSLSDNMETGELLVTAAVIVGIGGLAATWIQSTLKDRLKLSEAVHSEQLAQKSLAYRKELSKQKAEEAERLSEIARNTGNSRTGLLRVGILSGGLLGIGAALVVAQFVGMALLLAAFSGGGLAGYSLSKKTRAPRLPNDAAEGLKKYLPRPRDVKAVLQK